MHIIAPNKNKIGFIFEGNTTADVLGEVWETVQRHGKIYKGQRGAVKSIKGISLIINTPFKDNKNYPYWSKQEDQWYQDNFVKKETNLPPEIIKKGQDIYPYKYVWRSRYFDNGWGHILAVVELLKKSGFKKTKFKNKQELIDFLKKTYQLYHPETILAVLGWKGGKLMDFYLNHPELLNMEFATNRTDTLLTVIDEIKNNPNSRRAITHSFTYEHIDHSGVAGGVPVYQNYQLYTDFDSRGKPAGLISLHLHRALDARGGAQLDISHDREWGQIASQKTGLPLKKIVIYCNDIWYQVPEKGAHKDLETKTDVRSWLFAVTDGYDPATDDIEKRLSSSTYQKKIEYTLQKLTK